MNKKNGFTLIELLAVIVILAVIALIATPIIMGVINDSKKGAAKDSMYSYVKAVELDATRKLSPDTDLLSGTYTTKDGNLMNGTTKVLDVNMKGTKPEDNIGTITLVKGQVINADLKFDGYDIIYNSNISVIEEKVYTEGNVIYYNPNTNKKCTSIEVNTATNAKTGCMSWNVITMGDTTNKTTIDIMLNHNTTALVAWNSSNTNTEMKEVTAALQKDIITWDTSIKSTARLITGQEIANIGKDAEWNPGKTTGIKYADQLWLYQNLSSNNTTDKPYGYWTSTASSSISYNAWRMYYYGTLYSSDVLDADRFGIRPVITVQKTILN